MDGLQQEEMFVQKVGTSGPARPLPNQRTREPRVPT